MKKSSGRILYALCAVALLLSIVTLPNIGAATAESDVVSALPEQFKNVDRSHIFEYTAEDFVLANGYSVTKDTKSMVGSAIFCNGAKDETLILSKSKGIEIVVDGLSVGTIAMTDVKADQSYHLYKFNWVVPALNNGSYLYIFNDSVKTKTGILSQRIKSLEGKNVEIYVSMKVQGKVDGSDAKAKPSYYIDRFIIVEPCDAYFGDYSFDGGAYLNSYCSKCGATKRIEAFDSMSPNDILVTLTAGNAGDFAIPYAEAVGAATSDKIVDDAESVTGKAAIFSYAGRSVTGDAGLMNSMLRLGSQALDMRMYVPGISDESIGIVSIEEMQANANKGYTLYKFNDVNLLPSAASGAFIYMFDDWGFQIPAIMNYKEVLQDKTVDVYLSLKVTGDVTDSTDDTPAYYIDRVIITNPDPKISSHSECKFGNYEYQGDAYISAPSSASELLQSTDASDILAKFGYGNTAFTLPFNGSWDRLDVADPDSAVGHAAVISYQYRKDNGADAGGLNALIVSDALMFSHAGTGAYPGAITKAQLNENAQKGGYTLYKFNDVVAMPEGASTYNFIETFGWGFQIPLDSYKDVLSGKTVDVYLSMKVTGDVTNTTDNTPAYYIDSVIITKSDADEHPGTMVGTCVYGCGNTHTVPASAKHVKLYKAADIFKFAYGDAFEDKVVTDTDSVVGSAVQYAAYPRRNEGSNCLIMGPNNSITIYTTKSGEEIGDLRGESLKVDQGYQIYKFSFTNFTISDDPGAVYVFGDWGLQSETLANELKTYKGKNIDIYLSMKITGDIFGENLSKESEENWPVYRIDRVMIVESCTFGACTSDNNATCGCDGTKSHLCSVCNLQEYLLESGTATGKHDFTNKTVEMKYRKNAANCTSAAVYYTSCSICGMSSKNQPGEATFEVGSPLTHCFTYFGDGQEATCEANATQIAYCNHFCGETKVVEIPNTKLGHKYGSYVYDKNATCTKNGTKHRTCSVCGHEETVTASGTKLKHSYTDKASNKLAAKATCSSPALYYVQCDHCNAISKKLTVAIDEITEEHTYGDWISAEDGHNHKHVCSACEYEEKQAHSWDGGKTVKEATAEEDGEMVYTCTVCGETKTEVIKKLPVKKNDPVSVDDSGLPTVVWIVLGAVVDAGAIVAALLLLKKGKKKK